MKKILVISVIAIAILIGGYFVLVPSSADDLSSGETNNSIDNVEKDVLSVDSEAKNNIYEVAECGVSFEYDNAWRFEKIPGSVADNIMVAFADHGLVNINIPHEDLSVQGAIEEHKNKGCYLCGFRDTVESNINGIKVTELYIYGENDGQDIRPGRFYFKQNEQVCSLNDEGAPEELIMILNSLKVIEN